jgi:formyl-CoA transferase
MSVTGLPGQGPVRVGVAINDLTAGNLLAFGIMMALFDRTRTGVGRWVHTSLLEAQIFMLDFQAARYLMKQEVAGQAGNNHPTGIPSGVFPASDGQINISAPSPRVWSRFCDAIGKPEWTTKPEWSTPARRSGQRAEINAAISEVTRDRPSAHWVELFEEAGVPCGPINTIDQVFADPQVQHLGMAASVTCPRMGEYKLVASPLNVAGVPKGIRSPTLEPGTHTDEILRSVGYSAAEIDTMRAGGII